MRVSDVMVSPNKFLLYERAVQSPREHVELYERVLAELRGQRARSLREDFCGTFLMSAAWVRRSPDHSAIALDVDETALRDGKRRHWRSLRPADRTRLRALCRDARSVTAPKVDIVGVGNFSYCAFGEWDDLVTYFDCARRSLKNNGVIILEAAGGPGMTEEARETTTFKRNGRFWFRYIWDQRSFDPIAHRLRFSISFKLSDGRLLKDVFAYDWRLWTLPEIGRALQQGGFSDVKWYWQERDRNGRLSGVYSLVEKGQNDHAWISFAVGLK